VSKKISKKQMERRKKKQAQRAAMKALYKARAEAGETKGSRRRSIKKKYGTALVADHKHRESVCPNVGCARCREQAKRTRGIVVGPVSPADAA